VHEAKTFSDKHSLEAVLNTLKDDFGDDAGTGKEIVSKALSRRRARAKAISAIENELKIKRRRHATGQVKLVVVVSAVTWFLNRMHRDRRFRGKVMKKVRQAYSVWQARVVPCCKGVCGWVNQRKKAIQRALGPQGALPSRKNSAAAGLQPPANPPPLSSDNSSSGASGNERKGKKTLAQSHSSPALVARPPLAHQEQEQEQEKGKAKKNLPAAAVVGKGEDSPQGKGERNEGGGGTPVNDLDKYLAKIQEEEEDDDTDLFFSSFSEAEKKQKLPVAFFCPITKDVMKYPVIAADGHTYEREAIKKWLKEHKTSPNTNEVLRHTLVIPNHSLRSAIQEFESTGAKH